MAETTTETESTNESDALAGKYLTVQLADEDYGLPISPIDDIIEIQEITSVPQTPDFLKGVINLRGTVIPVIDLRLRFGMPDREYDEKTCIVVVTIDEVRTGLIVDRVEEVVDFTAEKIDPTPPMAEYVSERFLSGLGRKDESVIMLVDLDETLGEEHTEQLKDLQE